MDFIEGLPQSGSSNAILVVVDKYSKYAHFVRLRHPFQAAGVAKLFMGHVYKLHGLPSAIISDCDRIFTSKFWQSLFKLAGTSLHMSSAYHPQSDAQTTLINVWKRSSAALSTPAQLWGGLRLRFCTASLLDTWAFLLHNMLCLNCLAG
jgi:hypothetical protein